MKTTLARAMSTKNLGSPDDEAGMLRDILRQMHEMREAQEKQVQAESTSIIVDQADVTVTALPGSRGGVLCNSNLRGARAAGTRDDSLRCSDAAATTTWRGFHASRLTAFIATVSQRAKAATACAAIVKGKPTVAYTFTNYAYSTAFGNWLNGVRASLMLPAVAALDHNTSTLSRSGC